MHERIVCSGGGACPEHVEWVSRRIPLFSLPKACSEFTRRGGREVSMRGETVFRVTNSRYHRKSTS